MKRRLILAILVSLITLATGLQTPGAQVRKEADLQFKISRTGLEAADYKKVVLLTEVDEYYDENLGAGKIGLTEAMIRKECESRLGQAGLEPTSGFTRPEYLSIKVSIKYRSFYIAAQFNRPVSYRVEEIQFTKYGAVAWQKIVHGQHAYGPDYILENLGDLLEEFTKEYLKANSK